MLDPYFLTNFRSQTELVFPNMRIPSNHLPSGKSKLLKTITNHLRRVQGVQAIVLGGSHARGTARDDSDLDIGIYYAEQHMMVLDGILDLAQMIALPEKPPTVTDFYQWGPWVNGGAWIQTHYGKVDFLYKNSDQVRRTISDAQKGIVHHDFHQHPTFGFTSLIYLAETKYCIPLLDETDLLADLKNEVAVYPQKLKANMIRNSLSSAEFTLINTAGFAERGDVFNTVGCLTRTAFYLVQVLFALNEEYYCGDKGALPAIDQFSKGPKRFSAQIETILAHPGQDTDALLASTRTFDDLRQSVASVVECSTTNLLY